MNFFVKGENKNFFQLLEWLSHGPADLSPSSKGFHGSWAAIFFIFFPQIIVCVCVLGICYSVWRLEAPLVCLPSLLFDWMSLFYCCHSWFSFPLPTPGWLAHKLPGILLSPRSAEITGSPRKTGFFIGVLGIQSQGLTLV